MLKLERRPVADFLGAHHRQALQERTTSALVLAGKEGLSEAEKSTRIGSQWDNFRAGRTSRGTFPALWCELRAMAFDKCALCETPAPDTVEHGEEKSTAPAKAFDWGNLLAACSTCNRNRENSGSAAQPMDPSVIEPLDHFGWDQYGELAPNPAFHDVVKEHARMYGLHRFRGERARMVQTVRVLLTFVVCEQPSRAETLNALRITLTGTTAWLGPVRDYLLRPPTVDDALLVRGALRQLPEIRKWVEPWLRPPPWATTQWR